MTNHPLISVIIPSYNCASTIEVAIRSILEQTYPNLEIIVVDDNSTDNTREIVARMAEKHNIIFYHRIDADDAQRINVRGRNINAGWRARNYGFERSHGEWVVFQDADDASLLNRIEILYDLALRHGAWHVCAQWIQYRDELLGKKLDVGAIFKDKKDVVIESDEIVRLARTCKGFLPKVLGPYHRLIPFEWKRARFINKLFFGALDPYPGSGHPLIKREVMEHVKWRPLESRVWPTFMGRGADRDFNFLVAETFKKSIAVKLPLYLWRQDGQDASHAGYERYIA